MTRSQLDAAQVSRHKWDTLGNQLFDMKTTEKNVTYNICFDQPFYDEPKGNHHLTKVTSEYITQ